MIEPFNSSLAFSKFYMDHNYDFLGETVIDATVGNGNDTAWLLEQVGSTGTVIGFDIQSQAIESTRQRLLDAQNLTLIQDGHQNLLAYPYRDLACVLYNLGYLPKGDKTIATHSESTIASIQAASQLLKKGGVIMIIAYPGHPAGKEESDALESHLATYPQREFQCWKFAFINQRNNPPILYCLEKRRAK